MIPSHLELVEIKGRDNIFKILNYPKYHFFTLRVGTQRW